MSHKEWGGYPSDDSPVSGEKTQHQWTPSMMRGRGAVKPQLGKRSEHRGSTGQSPAAWCPTNVLQLRWEWSKYSAGRPFVTVRINVRYVMPCTGAPPMKQKDPFSPKPQSSPAPEAPRLKEGNQDFNNNSY